MQTVFSVLVPVYNVEQYIRTSIESIINQTFSDFELILVDDGSTDRSGLICDEYSEKDNRIRVIHNTNHGLLYTRRIAFSEASGKYCVIVDSDDKLKPQALQTIYNTFEQYKSDCVIYGYDRVCDGTVINTITDEDIVHMNNKRDIYMRIFLHTEYNPICRKSFKRSLLDGRDYSSYYHLSLREDLLQSIEILQNAQSITFIPDVLYEYTLNPNSMTQTIQIKNYKVDTLIRKSVLDFLRGCDYLSENDIDKYKTFCLELLCDEIKRIKIFDCSYKQTVEFLKKMRNDQYYQEILNKRYYMFFLLRNF